MDPAAMAGMAGGGGAAAPAPAPGATLKFSLVALIVMYICNNWKVVEVLQTMVMKIIAPMTGAMEQKREASAKLAASEAAAVAREARLARLRAAKAKGGGSGGAKKADADE